MFSRRDRLLDRDAVPPVHVTVLCSRDDRRKLCTRVDHQGRLVAAPQLGLEMIFFIVQDDLEYLQTRLRVQFEVRRHPEFRARDVHNPRCVHAESVDGFIISIRKSPELLKRSTPLLNLILERIERLVLVDQYRGSPRARRAFFFSISSP